MQGVNKYEGGCTGGQGEQGGEAYGGPGAIALEVDAQGGLVGQAVVHIRNRHRVPLPPPAGGDVEKHVMAWKGVHILYTKTPLPRENCTDSYLHTLLLPRPPTAFRR